MSNHFSVGSVSVDREEQPIISLLLPPEVVAVEAFGDDMNSSLTSEEMTLVSHWTPPRRAEFATARRCALEALGSLGAPTGAVAQGRHSEPIWPSGVVGAITHCRGYRAAAVAWQVEILGLGIDAEPAVPLADGVLSHIADLGEMQTIPQKTSALDERIPWGTVIFSAKEAAFKALHPLIDMGFNFTQVGVRLEPKRGTFYVNLRATREKETRSCPIVYGRFRIVRGFVLTTATIYSERSGLSGEDTHEFYRP